MVGFYHKQPPTYRKKGLIMKQYERPTVMLTEGIAEGVYMASGDGAGGGGDCYTVTARIHQKPETGREDYRIQVDATHAATHHSTGQTLIISFNMPVNYVSCNARGAKLESGDGTDTLTIGLGYHNNFDETIGFGDLVVTAAARSGLAVTGAELQCNRTCAQHDSLY